MSHFPLLSRYARQSWRVFSTFLLAPLLASSAQAQMHDLGVLPNGSFSQGTAISGDGALVAGVGADALDNQWLLLWSADKGWVKVAPFTGFATVHAASGDGSVLVGAARLNGASHAFRWEAATGLVDLGTFGGVVSQAWGISSDGQVIVGDAANAALVRRAFRWTAGQGLQELGGLTPTGMSIAFAVSGDGAVAVGTAANSSNINRAVLWQGGTIVDLGTLHGSAGGGALGVNADGSVVVGASDVYAFRWTAAGGMQDLGSLGGGYAAAQDVSADGAVVVGNASWVDDSDRAFRWTAETGMVSLGLLHGGTYSLANGVSDDGRIIVGTADNASGERAFIWKDAVLQDLGHVQGSVLGSADTSAQLLGSQARRTRAIAEKRCIPGAIQHYCLSLGGGLVAGEGDANSLQTSAAIGAGIRLDSHFSLGANLIAAQARWHANNARQDAELGFGAWLAYQQHAATGTGWNAVASAATSGGTSRFSRGERGADVQQASSQVDLRTTAARLAVGYGFALGHSLLTPELAITHSQGRRQGFTEHHVVLPLQVYGSRSAATYASLAVRGEVPVSERATLQFGLGVDILLSERQPTFTGQSQIPGLARFDLPSTLQQRHLLPLASAGYRYALSDNASLGAQAQVAAAAFAGQRPVYGLELEYRYRF
ncbi:MAG: autotransporter domain-containing protein [Pseudomonas sp.]